MTPETMADFQTVVTAQKAIQRGEPEALASLFTLNSDARLRSTRQDRLFHLPRPRLETGKRRFGYRAAALLNTLPRELALLPPGRFARAAKTRLKRK